MSCNECEKNCLECEMIPNEVKLKITEIIKKVSERRKGKDKSLSKQLEEVIENLPSVAQQEIQEIFFQTVIIVSLITSQLQSDYSEF